MDIFDSYIYIPHGDGQNGIFRARRVSLLTIVVCRAAFCFNLFSFPLFYFAPLPQGLLVGHVVALAFHYQ